MPHATTNLRTARIERMYLILAMLLTVVQAAPPVPWQAPDNTARSSQNVTKNAKANQGPSKVPPALQGSAPTEPNQHGSQTPTDSNAKETIVIRELAPVPVKDWWDRSYVIFTGLLVLVGIAASLLARHTLNTIQQQLEYDQFRRSCARIRELFAELERLTKAA